MPARRCPHCPDMLHRTKGLTLERIGQDGSVHTAKPERLAAICGRILLQ